MASSQIRIMNADGTNRTQLTSDLSDTYPTFSPDGTKIAFTSSRDAAGQFIYTINADGTGVVTRLTTVSASDLQPAYSPNGTKIVFSSTRDNALSDIYVMDADGKNVVRLTTSKSGFYPTWSPDGTKIAFENRTNGYRISLMNADGTNQTELFPGSPTNVLRPSWGGPLGTSTIPTP